MEITEVLKEEKTIHFAATKSLKFRKLIASADLKGKVYINEANGLAHIDCLVGESIYPIAIVSLSSIEMKRELKTNIIRLFDGETAPLKHPLIP